MLPGLGPVYTAYDSSNIEAALHFKLYSCLVAASYIIAVLPIYIVLLQFLNVSLGN